MNIAPPVTASLPDLTHFWSLSADELTRSLDTTAAGLTSTEAKRRLRTNGPNRLQSASKTADLVLFLRQFKSPLIIILLVAVGLSFFLNESVDAVIIVAIVLLSSILGFWQEKRASDAVKALLSVVRIKTKVIRDGKEPVSYTHLTLPTSD